MAACGGASHPAPSSGTAPAAPAAHGIGRLAIGLTEANAALLSSPRARPQAPAGFGPARDALSALRPAYLRIDLDWAKLQPAAGQPPRLDLPVSGCARAVPPCAPYAGLADELRAIASQQHAGGGFEPVITIFDAPAWATRTGRGCQAAAAAPGARPLTASGLAAYRALLGAVAAQGNSAGVALRWWSPWDEPNHPLFISPQRAACTTSSVVLSAATYATLARAMGEALRAAGGERRLVLGELADFPRPRRNGAGIGEFVSALPEDVVCSAAVWAQHEYPKAGARGATPGGVLALERALDATGACGRAAHIWVTETGAGSPHAGAPRATAPAALAGECRLLARALDTWYRDPRVDAAFQYTFREDASFPVGLADPGLRGLYPSYYLLRAWAGGRAPDAPPPGLPAQCA